MPINITIEVDGITKAIAALTKVGRGIKDHRDFLEDAVVPELRKEFSRVFTTRGYGRWRALKPSTVRQKSRQGYPTDPLQRTGYYKRASEKLTGMRIRRNVLEIRSPVPYARYHEYGTGKIPERQVFTAVAQKIRPELPRLYRNFAQRKILP